MASYFVRINIQITILNNKVGLMGPGVVFSRQMLIVVLLNILAVIICTSSRISHDESTRFQKMYLLLEGRNMKPNISLKDRLKTVKTRLEELDYNLAEGLTFHHPVRKEFERPFLLSVAIQHLEEAQLQKTTPSKSTIFTPH